MKERILGIVRASVSFFTVAVLFILLGNVPAGFAGIDGQTALEQGWIYIDYACVIGLLLMLPLLYSLVRTEVVYDDGLHTAYMEKRHQFRTVWDKAAFFAEQKRFWMEAAAFAAVYWILPLETFNRCLVLQLTDGTPGVADKLILFIALCPLFLLSDLIARVSASNRWQSCAYKTEMEQKKRFGKIRQYGLCILAYGAGSAALIVMVVPVVMTLLTPILGEIRQSEGVPGILIAIGVLIALVWGVRVLKAFFTRRAFFARLKKICEEKGYTLSDVKHPYLSALFFAAGESFSVQTESKRYSCKMIGSLRKHLPLILHPDGNGCHVHTVRLYKTELFRYETWFTFGYESEDSQVLIVNPVPKKVWGHDGRRTALLDNGDRAGNFRFYAGTAFLNALERECLDR